MSDIESLMQTLYSERIRQNLTVQELAIRSGVNERSIYEYEKGSHLPSLKNIVKLGKGLSLHLGWSLNVK